MPELVFKGKEYVYNHHLTVPYRPLIAQPEKSIGPADLAGNLIIHGDNLHALKSLLPRYAGKVDLIFIDPPYNTGNENWSYNDNVNSPIMREWLKSNPVNVEDMLRHDKWLCRMWPRLTLLRELLSERGSLWMTLDDNEVHRARVILDELFGEENFLAQMAWEKVYSPRMDASGFSKDHDVVLAYAKSKPEVFLATQSAQQNERQFTYIEPDTGKKARLRTLRKEGSESLRSDRENCWYAILAPDGSKIWPVKPDGTEGRWRWEKSTYSGEAAKKPSKVIVEKNADGKWEVWVKQYFKGEADQPISTILHNEQFGHTHEATEEVKRIFGEKVFDTPKPSRLLTGILGIATSENSLILDSFAGSGTTAHAVLKVNAKHGGARKFILVEGEDYADRITAERVRRVINGYAYIGTQHEELLREKVTWSKLQKSTSLLDQVEAIKRREGFAEREDLASVSPENRRFDKVNVKMDDGVLLVEGEKKISERVEGLGGEFTFCTLGEPIDAAKILSGEQLPDYASLAAWLFYTATGATLAKSRIKAKEFFIGKAQDRYVWLIYKPDMTFLKSPDAALTLSFAKKLREKHKHQRHLVFAPAKYLSNKQLLEFGVEFAPLPFALYREA